MPIEGRFRLEFGSLGKQNIFVLLNGQLLGKYQLDSWCGEIEFHFDAAQLNRNDVSTLEFKLPDAHRPASGDERVLALTLRSLALY